MSVIVVEAHEFDRLTNSLSSLGPQLSYQHKLNSWEAAHRTAYNLYALNVRNYNRRYGEDMPTLDYKEFCKAVRTARVYAGYGQLLHSCEFLDYQIEIDQKDMTPEESEAYNNMQSVMRECRRSLLERVPEYKNAAWGM